MPKSTLFSRCESPGTDRACLRGPYWNCISFLLVATINNHKLNCSKQYTFIILQFSRSKSKMGFTGLKSKCRQGCVPSGGSKGESFHAFSSFWRVPTIPPLARLQPVLSSSPLLLHHARRITQPREEFPSNVDSGPSSSWIAPKTALANTWRCAHLQYIFCTISTVKKIVKP